MDLRVAKRPGGRARRSEMERWDGSRVGRFGRKKAGLAGDFQEVRGDWKDDIRTR